MSNRWSARKSSFGWWGVWDTWSDRWEKNLAGGFRQFESESGAKRAARKLNRENW